MRISSSSISEHNTKKSALHAKHIDYISGQIEYQGIDSESVIQKLMDLQVAVPSWALGTGGTRFGRFPSGGEPRNLEEKIEDVGLLHALNQSSGAISLHIPWDIPDDYHEVSKLAESLGLKFDAVNSNTFQDQKGQELS